MGETLIAEWPPSDGRDWDAQCARCGSTAISIDCESCDGGLDGHDCGEDSCCCLDAEPNVTCQFCRGAGHFMSCCSGEEWCQAHPMAGREEVEHGVIEWFVVPERAHA